MSEVEGIIRRRWPWLLGVVVLVVVVALALVLWPRSNGGTGNAEKSVQDNSAGDLDVVAGMGGAKTGPDGKTAIGYEDTCKGAVEAATNYSKLLTNSSLNPPENTDSTIDEVVLDHDLAKDKKFTTSVQALRQSVSDDELKVLASQVGEQFHPEWSGKYLVRDCNPGKDATVSVAGGGTSGDPGGGTQRSFYTVTYDLVWSDNDWHIQKEQDSEDGPKTPYLDESNGLPKPTKADTTQVTYKDGKFTAKQADENRPVMDSQAYEKAFDGVSPDISKWFNYSKADES